MSFTGGFTAILLSLSYNGKLRTAHRQLIDRREKLKRKLVLSLIDTRDVIAETETQESLPAAFGWHGGYSHHYMNTTAVIRLRKISMWMTAFL
jgi:hypothetical protein